MSVGRFQAALFPAVRMGRTLESLHRTLANGFQVRAVCNVSLGHRFHVSNEPVKNPSNRRQRTTAKGSITSLLALGHFARMVTPRWLFDLLIDMTPIAS